MSIFDYSTTPGANTGIDGINIAEGMPPGNVNNAMRAMMADTRKFQLDTGFTATTSGSGNAYTLQANQGFGSYANGMRFTARFDRNNTGPASINVSNVGSVPLRISRGGETIPLIANDIQATGIYDMVYQEVINAFVLLNTTAVRLTDVSMIGANLLGRSAAGTGAVSTIALGAGVEFNGNVLRVAIGNGTGLNDSGITYLNGGIALQFATLTQAQNGLETKVVMSPLNVAQYTRANAFGYGQTPKNITVTTGQIRTNSTTRPIFVGVAGTNIVLQSRADASSEWVTWSVAVESSRQFQTTVVGPGQQWRVQSGTIIAASEYS